MGGTGYEECNQGDELWQSEETHKRIFENHNQGMAIFRLDGRSLHINRRLAGMLGYTGRQIHSASARNGLVPFQSRFRDKRIWGKISQPGGLVDEETDLVCKSGQTLPVMANGAVIDRRMDGNHLVFISVSDLSRRKALEEESRRTTEAMSARLASLEDEVREKQRALDSERVMLQECRLTLEKVRDATKILTARMEECQADLRERVSNNANRTLYPLIARLRSTALTDAQQHLVNALEFNIRHLTAGSDLSLARSRNLLSPRELEVCKMIHSGKTYHEIAACLGVSPETILVHRRNIRKKLGLKDKKRNLETFIRECV